MNKIVFVSDVKHLKSEIPGGVQICTREYIELLRACNLDVTMFPVEHSKNISTRIKIKLGIGLYQRYDFEKLSRRLIDLIEKENAKYVALNQVAFLGFGPIIKKRLGDRVKVIVLSHGNESGDIVHSIVRAEKQKNVLQLKDISYLGFVLYQESFNYTNNIDIVLSISNTDMEINNWLGAKTSIFVPRTFNPKFVDWKPELNRIGFIGTLDHKPNIDSLTALIEELGRKGANHLKIRVVGGPEETGRELEQKYEMVDYLGRLDDESFTKEATSWAIFLNPVFWYSRGATTKLALGINLGLPIASTHAGNRGYEWHKGSVMTADNAEMMAGQILENVGSFEKLRALALQVRLIPDNSRTIYDIAETLKKYL